MLGFFMSLCVNTSNIDVSAVFIDINRMYRFSEPLVKALV